MAEDLDKPLTARELEKKFGLKPKREAPKDPPSVPLHECNLRARAYDKAIKQEKDELGVSIKDAIDVVMGKRKANRRVLKDLVAGQRHQQTQK